MYIDRLKSPVIEQELKQVIQQAAARDVTVELRTGATDDGPSDAPAGASGGGSSGTSRPARAARKDAEPGPKAKQVMKKFGGRVVEVNPKDRVQRAPAPSPEHEPDGDMLDPGEPPER